MTWAGGHCLNCQKRIPLRQKGAEFCSAACGAAHSKNVLDDRHGIIRPASAEVPASVRAIAKSHAVTRRIREHVDANRTALVQLPETASEPPLAATLALALPSSRRDFNSAMPSQLDPARPLDTIQLPTQTVKMPPCQPVVRAGLTPLSPPPQRPLPVAPRGFFAFFPIGDLALVAPVELPVGTTAFLMASPRPMARVYPLGAPPVSAAQSNVCVGLVLPRFAQNGGPTLAPLSGDLPSGGFPLMTGLALAPPPPRNAPWAIARQSQLDQLVAPTAPALPKPQDNVLSKAQFASSELNVDFLSLSDYAIRPGGASIVTLAPPCPAACTTPPPAILPSLLTLSEPTWLPGVLIAVPGLTPQPAGGKLLIQELAPWFVPSRPKAPALALEILPTPAGWQHLRQGFVANAAAKSAEPNSSLSAVATALEEPSIFSWDRRRASLDSPWPRKRQIPVFTPIMDWWMTCSNEVKVMVIALPLLCAIAIRPLTHTSAGAPSMEERPSAPVRSAHTTNPRQTIPEVIPTVPAELEERVEKVTKSKFDGFKRSIVSRAAVEMADDFQSGLDSWEGNGQLGPSWSYDRTGFIRPRSLGIYTPSMPLSDYTFEFLAKMDQRAVSWAFRASDFNNYYAMKLVDKTGGSTPQMALVHYAVIEGREGPKKEVPLPISVYKDTLFRIRMDIQGPHFSVQVQGTVVDYWKDSRLKSGGVGFFASRGEESRVRWVQVTHQDDMLGKLCALLAPYAL